MKYSLALEPDFDPFSKINLLNFMPLDHLLLDVIFNDLLSFSSLLICKRVSFVSVPFI